MNSSAISTARVIEFGSVTAGIAVPEEGGFRFFSSQRAFDALDGRRFRSIKQATAAASGRWRRTDPAPEPRSSRAKPEDPTADLRPAFPGPLPLPV
jgi:hypothetical protein